jgi:hypothetical protein
MIKESKAITNAKSKLELVFIAAFIAGAMWADNFKGSDGPSEQEARRHAKMLVRESQK